MLTLMNSIDRGAAPSVIAQVHPADLQTHNRYRVHHLRYRVDEAARTKSLVGVDGKP